MSGNKLVIFDFEMKMLRAINPFLLRFLNPLLITIKYKLLRELLNFRGQAAAYSCKNSAAPTLPYATKRTSKRDDSWNALQNPFWIILRCEQQL